MKTISIFGLGYVGCVSLGCIANNGYNVIGVDVNDLKVELINKGKATIVEKDIDVLVGKAFEKKQIRATKDFRDAILASSISVIAVGTPSTKEGHLNLNYIFETAKQIGETIKEKKTFHTIVIRSTVLPGTNIKYGDIVEKYSGKKRNVDFAVVSNPEFLREGTAVADYYNPPVTVLGGDNKEALAEIAQLYDKVGGEKEFVQIRVAEIIKYVNNSYHALKIVFGNEVGNICKKLGIDSHEVMRVFCLDTQLNISNYYFKPGFAYGGSCLPKDLMALKTLAHDNYIDVPVLNNIEKSNVLQKNIALDIIESKNKKKIFILGLSFKPGTDDLRYSPIVEVIERLLGKGYEVKIVDKNVQLSKIMGQNKSYIMEKLPHIGDLMIDSIDEGLAWSEVVVFTNKEKDFADLNIADHKLIVDLTRYDQYNTHVNYEGLNW